MERERYERIRSVFHAVCDAAPDEQERQLERLCAGDAGLRDEVRRLLEVEASEARSAAMSDLAARVQEQLADELGRAGASEPPAAFGAYRITREIGSGGMGTVYEAEQEFPRRTVALKIIRPGLVTDALLKRFEYEAHVLGLLQHPGIAQIHEAGTAMTDAGPQAFFAMELAHGRTLREYVRSEEPDVATRLRIVAELCEAIHHAHTRGVVHRDLKPSNIVVDDVGHPKILDFGVARMTESDLRTTTLRTGMGELIGTIPYMSPEQAAGRSDDVDTRTDVYALGVILFELLAGALPHEVEGSPIHEAVRTIREDEPRSLSSFGRHLRGDLETIVETALAKDKARRYQTAIELAADIRRHIEDQPIVARPPSALYQLRKFAKRNKALVGGFMATLLALVVGVTGTSYGMWRANEQRERAEGLLKEASAAREEAEAVTDFTVRMIGMASPEGAGREVRVVDVLEVALGEITSEMHSRPRVHSRLLLAIGESYQELGVVEKAKTCFRNGFELAARDLGSRDTLTLALQSGLGVMRSVSGAYEEGLRDLKLACSGLSSTVGETDPQTMRAMLYLASAHVRVRDLDQATKMLEEVSRVVENSTEDAGVRRNLRLQLARAQYAAGELAQSERTARELIAEQAADYAAIVAAQQIASVRREMGDYEEAQRLLLSARDACEERYGPKALPTMCVEYELALILYSLGDSDEAEELLRAFLEMYPRQLPGDTRGLILARNSLARVLFDKGEFDEADEILMGTLSIATSREETQPILLAHTKSQLGALRMRQLQFAEAALILEDALRTYGSEFGIDDPSTLAVEHDWALCLARSGQFERAEESLRDVIGRTEGRLGAEHPRVATSMMVLARMLAEAGRFDESRREALASIKLSREVFDQGSPLRVYVLAEYGNLLLSLSDLAGARRAFHEAREELLAADTLDEMRLQGLDRALRQLDGMLDSNDERTVPRGNRGSTDDEV